MNWDRVEAKAILSRCKQYVPVLTISSGSNNTHLARVGSWSGDTWWCSKRLLTAFPNHNRPLGHAVVRARAPILSHLLCLQSCRHLQDIGLRGSTAKVRQRNRKREKNIRVTATADREIILLRASNPERKFSLNASPSPVPRSHCSPPPSGAFRSSK